MAYSYVQNEKDAPDIVSESAYKAIFFAEKLKRPEQLKSWVDEIVRKRQNIG